MKIQNINQFFEQSSYHMADITKKQATFRRAVAMGRIYVGEVGYKHISEQTLPKGDVLKLSEIAGVQGAKNAWQQMPMCHPLLLDHVAVFPQLEPATKSVAIYVVVATTAKTGVEMEALAGVQAALLTLYDLTKPVEPALTMSDSRLLLKEGGKKGLWLHPDGVPEELSPFIETKSQPLLANINVAVVTLSDRASKGEYQDRSGAWLCEQLQQLGANLVDYQVIADEAKVLSHTIDSMRTRAQLIVTTGGTGIAPRDITVATITSMAKFIIPGIGELLRSSGAQNVPTAWLSRSVAAVIDDTLVLTLPGSTGGVKDGIEALKGLLPHCLKLLGHQINNDNICG
ncbi:bifunctional molybdenum cofactor biosynthesis protein MoaC/MoaB [Paraferrimonas sp. SM1919]|uniref:bifunctional molybdenum cofactor biosynthesis protein MoaC/MoaB n=1 Tax=Paraferrimonas sp. SM1919 TaxID=2662263 RepID=UPI0013CFE286|nr:bifunctional molybdenum cofactor biosynthesis protein MoaC/MoaB [Paraferrimonas sp. SM1919]